MAWDPTSESFALIHVLPPGLQVLLPPCRDRRTAGDESRPMREERVGGSTEMDGVAVIVEPRRLRRLPFVLANMLEHLPRSSWNVTLWHGPSIQAKLALVQDLQPHSTVLRALRKGRLSLLPLPFEPPKNRIWYNHFTVSDQFWSAFAAPWLLLFEADTVLCPQPSSPLASFQRHLYVGAPWRGREGMNSGLSLWRRDAMAARLAAPLAALLGNHSCCVRPQPLHTVTSATTPAACARNRYIPLPLPSPRQPLLLREPATVTYRYRYRHLGNHSCCVRPQPLHTVAVTVTSAATPAACARNRLCHRRPGLHRPATTWHRLAPPLDTCVLPTARYVTAM